MRSFSRRSLSSGNAGFRRTSIQIFSPSSTCRRGSTGSWPSRARQELHPLVDRSPVIVVVPPVRMIVEVSAEDAELVGRLEEAVDAAAAARAPAGRGLQAARPKPPAGGPATGERISAWNHGISWSSTM
jgi:hypothetical protein